MSALASAGDSVPQCSQGNPWDSGGNIRVESYPGSRNINSHPSFLVNVSIRNVLISQMFHSPGRPEQCSSVLQPEAPLRKLSARICTCLGQQPEDLQARAMAGYNFFLFIAITIISFPLSFSSLHISPLALSNSWSLLLISYCIVYINIYSYTRKYNLLSLYVPYTCCPFGMNSWCALPWLRLFPPLSAPLSCLGSLGSLPHPRSTLAYLLSLFSSC